MSFDSIIKKALQHNYLLIGLFLVYLVTIRINPVDILYQSKKVSVPSAKNPNKPIQKVIGKSLEASVMSWINLYYPLQNPNCNTKCASSCPKPSTKKFSKGLYQSCMTDKCHCNIVKKTYSQITFTILFVSILSILYLMFLSSLEKPVEVKKQAYTKIQNESSSRVNENENYYL